MMGDATRECSECGATIGDHFWRCPNCGGPDHEDPTGITDYLARFEVEQWHDDEKTVDDIVLRVAGTSESAAVDGATKALGRLSHVANVEAVDVWRDET